MQALTGTDPAALIDRLVSQAMPDRRGLAAWQALLRAQASLMRQLDTDLVGEGLVTRAGADTDARGVVVALTDAGLARLAETAPVHMRGVAHLFADRLDDRELETLEHTLEKVTIDCSFG